MLSPRTFYFIYCLEPLQTSDKVMLHLKWMNLVTHNTVSNPIPTLLKVRSGQIRKYSCSIEERDGKMKPVFYSSFTVRKQFTKLRDCILVLTHSFVMCKIPCISCGKIYGGNISRPPYVMVSKHKSDLMRIQQNRCTYTCTTLHRKRPTTDKTGRKPRF